MQASPSKARAQALASHAWSVVHEWLARLYHPSPVPAFERNAVTLRALQGLMAENIAADRVRELLFAAKVEELAAGGREKEDDDDEGRDHEANAMFSMLETSLASAAAAQTALESLAGSVVLLGGTGGVSPSKPSTSATDDAGASGVVAHLTSQIVNIPRQTFALESQLSAIESLAASLRSQIVETQRTLAAFAAERAPREPSSAPSRPGPVVDDPTSRSSTFRPTTPSSSSSPTTPTTTSTTDPSHLHNLTLQHQRETKQLTLKAAEYKSRIEALERRLSTHPADAPDLAVLTTAVAAAAAAKQQSLSAKKKQLETLQGRFEKFHGLPPDVDVSRAEVRRAEGELDALRRRRDELFEAL
ncbi:hypothetical protein AYO22_01612 [Fonsecaea multimorphosa]|nr:hypothetical protein AYO22_01612 [Fonsecaea multimorphosa]